MRTVHVDEHLAFAVTWTVEEPMERSSHALGDGGRVWLIDPVADDAALVAAERMGEIAGVIQLLDRHPRDCRELAERYGVAHARLPEHVEGAPFEVVEILSVPGWRELGLWWEGHSLAVIPEAIGSGRYFAAGGGPLGVHPMLRLWPPGSLRRLEPEILLTGHGPPVHEDAAAALREALERSRRDAPRATFELVRSFMPRR